MMSRALLHRILVRDQAEASTRDGIQTKTAELSRSFCSGCFEKQREVDQLKAEIIRLKAELGRKQRKAGAFGSDTHKPSSRLDTKPAAAEDEQKKRGGARVGHKGKSRPAPDRQAADSVVRVELPAACPCCQGPLKLKGIGERRVLDVIEQQVQDTLYEIVRGYCGSCKQSVKGPLPVLPRALLGNQLLAEIAVQHYFDGITLGKLTSMLGGAINTSTIVSSLHRLSRLFEPAISHLIDDYRNAKVKHADETGWRTDGDNGYGWVFCSVDTVIFKFTDTRAARIPEAIFGRSVLTGVLVVDRYAGYSSVPCKIQYCYAHLLREVEKLAIEFEESQEVRAFVDTFAPLLADAMRLGRQPISDSEYYAEAGKLRAGIVRCVEAAAEHLGIRHIQGIFSEHEGRLFHWVEDRDVPCHNNYGERTVRGTVIARKISFGSQSKQGAASRSTLMSVLHTAKARLGSRGLLVSWLKSSLDQLSNTATSTAATLLPPPLRRPGAIVPPDG